MSNIQTTTYSEFYTAGGPLLESFKRCLLDFHLHLVSVEGMGLMRTVDNAGEWYSKELFDGDKRNADKPMRMSYVADDNTLVGFIIWRIEVRGVGSDVTDWPEVRIADVLELYVAPESRGKWIGRKLLDTVQEDAKKESVDYISIDVLSNNKVAVSAYESFGCVPWCTTMMKKVR